MKTYIYPDLKSFEQAMKRPEELAEMSKSVVLAIKEASSTQKKVADICSIVFDVESVQIRLSKTDWPEALLNSMKHMEVAGYVDEVIDAYVLHRELTQKPNSN
jgi:hypothetical protein